jgi:hypothetical protein
MGKAATEQEKQRLSAGFGIVSIRNANPCGFFA